MIRYRLRLDCEAGFGTCEEWSKNYFTDIGTAKVARDVANARGGQSAMVVALWPGDWRYESGDGGVYSSK